MTPQQYLEDVLKKYNLTEGEVANLQGHRQYVQGVLETYFGTAIETVYNSGSYAKGTAVNLGFDLDVCPYFKRSSFGTLEEMYFTVLECLREEDLEAIEQTVSIHIDAGGNGIDIVPARSLSDGSGNANLYVTTKRNSLLTNIPKHRDYVSTHNARPVIKLMKVWRHRHGIHFKSFALELLVIKALADVPSGADLPSRLRTALEFARDHAADARLLDPANSGNVVSDLIDGNDKQNLARQAGASLAKRTWEEVLW